MKPIHNNNFCIEDKIESLSKYWLNFRKKCIKRISGNLNLKIGVWNLQSLNLDINNRYIKLEFIRDTLLNNIFDMIFLIDVNSVDSILLNGYNKYTDGRNILFVKDEVLHSFIISNNCIFNKDLKLAFVYLTPASGDAVLIKNILVLLQNDFTIIGDLNLKSNKILSCIDHFTGEDSLQTGAVSRLFIRTFSIAAPSDHRFLIFEIKLNCNLARSLKLGEIGYDTSRNFICDILRGHKTMAQPKVTAKQYRVGLNDREQSINAMLDDYLRNNVAKIFKRYNFLWRFNRREPFLGKSVPTLVKETYARHLRADPNKKRDLINHIKYNKLQFFTDTFIKRTRSKAVNFDFVSLCNIPSVLKDFLLDPDNSNVDIINNIIDYVNNNNDAIISEVFFLQKNPIVRDFNDVRVIILIPSVIKIFECLIFDRVMSYFSNIISKSCYQFGGVRNGSTYEAILKIKLLQKKLPNATGILLMDMSKGYDTVNLSLLENDILKFGLEPEIEAFSMLWVRFVYIMDLTVNDELVYRTRGVPMGLSLSPIYFSFYVHNSLIDIDKERVSMYLDDLALILTKFNAQGNLDFIFSIIDAFAKYELVINTKKTVYITNDSELDKLLCKDFKKVDSATYLGRQIALNGDGKILPDNRFYNLKGFRSNSIPFWATFFVKRIIFNAALDAKLRYRLIMWSNTDLIMRTAIWRNNWSFFKKSMGQFSYTQLAYCTFNIFRYFIDITDVIKYREDHSKGIPDETIFANIKTSIRTKDIARVNDAIDIMDFSWDWEKYSSKEISDFSYTKKFINHIWTNFLRALVVKYYQYKKDKNEIAYAHIEKFMNSRLFKCFGILQNVVFLHFIPKDNRKKSIFRYKDIFVVSAISALRLNMRNSFKIILNNPDKYVTPNMLSISKFHTFVFPDDIIKWPLDKWEDWLKQRLAELWPFIDFLMELIELKSSKGLVDDKELIDTIFADKNRLIVFVDGSFSGNSGGWGFCIYNNDNKELFRAFGQVPSNLLHLRNVAGELMATLNAVQECINRGYKAINLCYDFIGIYKYFSTDWAPNDNFTKNYILHLKDLSKKIDIHFYKVPSHSGIEGNDLADILAKKGAGLKVNAKDSGDLTHTQEQINCFKDLYKFGFKFLTIVETIYLNNNLNDLDYDYLWLNLSVKFYNLDSFSEKQYNMATLDEHLDPLEDNVFDIFT